jgi:hypothetical protein
MNASCQTMVSRPLAPSNKRRASRIEDASAIVDAREQRLAHARLGRVGRQLDREEARVRERQLLLAARAPLPSLLQPRKVLQDGGPAVAVVEQQLAAGLNGGRRVQADASLASAQHGQRDDIGLGAVVGELDAAVITLTCKELKTEGEEWAVRLRYAYADALFAAGRKEEATEWFEKCAEIDVDEITDAQDRASE